MKDHQNHPQDHQNHPQDDQNHLQDHPNKQPLGGLLICRVLEVILVVLGVVLVVLGVVLRQCSEQCSEPTKLVRSL